MQVPQADKNVGVLEGVVEAMLKKVKRSMCENHKPSMLELLKNWRLVKR